MIKREMYLEKIRPFYDSSLVKVIVGIRRCGKSELLKQIVQEIRQTTDAQHIIYLPLDNDELSFINSPQALSKHIKEQIKDESKYFIFIDEIQLINGFEKTIGSLKSHTNSSIFITGSNSKLLAKELSTLLSGRYVAFRIQPFTYQESIEYLTQKQISTSEDTFYDFCKWGSLPQRFDMQGEAQIRVFLEGVYASVVLHDILERAQEGRANFNQNLLRRIIDFLLDGTGQTFSARNVFNKLRSSDSSVQAQEVYDDIEYIVNSFCVSKCPRYDIKGKEILQFYEKYYATDLGLRTITKTNLETDLSLVLETVLYNEFIARGYDVLVGKTYKGEVDFIVINEGKKCFVQVCYLLATQDTINREFGAYSPISDASPKYVLSMDKFDLSREGITHVNIIDFLLHKKELIFS